MKNVKNVQLFKIDCQGIDAGMECWRKQRPKHDAEICDELTRIR